MSTFQHFFLDSTRHDLPISSNLTATPQPPVGTPIPPPKQVIDFLTLQSLTFPVAAGLVTGAWQVIQALAGNGANWGDSKFVPFVIAVVIIIASVATQWSTLGGVGARIGATLVGLVNALLLTGGALGILSVATNSPVS
jgi:hypothetical protein